MSVNFENDPEFRDVISEPSASQGFRLGEVLLIVAILAVPVGLLLPTTSQCHGPSMRRAACTSNLRKVVLALLAYERDHGALPPAYTVDADGRPLHSWRTLILPYLDQEALYRTIDLSKPWNDPANAKALGTTVYVFCCPEQSFDRPNTTTFLATVAPNGCLIPKEPCRLAEIKDPRDSTLTVIEAGAEHAVPWMAPSDADESLVLNLGSATKLHHKEGIQVGFVDGSAKFLKTDTPVHTLRAMMTISSKDDATVEEW